MKSSTSKPVTTISFTVFDIGTAMLEYARRDNPSIPDDAEWRCTLRGSDYPNSDNAASIWWTKP